jgi:hypothetical protein
VSERRAALQGRIAALIALIADGETTLRRLRAQLDQAEDELAEIPVEAALWAKTANPPF